MPYYEVVYETGAHGVAFYEDEAEMRSALSAHEDRAKSGKPGGPSGHSAERIAKVIEYATHPGSLNEDQTMSTEVAKSEVAAAMKEATKDGVVDIPLFTALIRDITRPLVDANADDPHSSIFKMEGKELAWQ